MSFLSIFVRALQSWPTVRSTLLPKIHSNSKSVGLLCFPGSQSLYTSSGVLSAGDLQRCLQFFIALLGLFRLMQMLLMASDSNPMTFFIGLSLSLASVVLKIIKSNNNYASVPSVHASERVKVHVLSSQKFWVRNERTRVSKCKTLECTQEKNALFGVYRKKFIHSWRHGGIHCNPCF